LKIRVEVEPGDVVRAAQRQHKNISKKEAEQALRKMEPAITHAFDDLKHSLLPKVVDVALAGRNV
jgi:hypothetical protein